MTQTKTALAIRHVGFEHLGSFAPVLAARDFAITMADAGVDPLAGRRESPDLLVVLGAPIGATDEALYPCLLDELRLIERQLKTGRPVLGVCLGAQLIARVLGAGVYKAPRQEIGWAALTPTAEGAGSCLSPLAENKWQVLHWHGDTFDLPKGAQRLASTECTENQAFTLGSNVLALQFHLEVFANQIEHWLIGHAVELAAAPGVDVAELRADTARWGPGLDRVGPACLEMWLEEAFGDHAQPASGH